MHNLQQANLVGHLRKLAKTCRPMHEPDGQLLQQFLANRDEAAFAALVQRHGPMVLGVCRSVLGHRQDAEDALQATFLVLARRTQTIRKQGALGSWLHGVAYRLAHKARTQAARRRARENPAPKAVAATPLDDLSVREWQAILHEELGRLPEKYRAALLLCYWEGKTRDEAADQLGLARGTLREQLERARKLLRSRLTRRGLVPSAAMFTTVLAGNDAGALGPTLITNTAKAAVLFAGKSAPVGLVSAAALALATGRMPMMFAKKWMLAVLVALVVGGLAGAITYLAVRAPSDIPGPREDDAAIAGPRGDEAANTWVDGLAKKTIRLDHLMAECLETSYLDWQADPRSPVRLGKVKGAENLISELEQVNKKFDSLTSAERTIWWKHALAMDHVKQRIEKAIQRRVPRSDWDALPPPPKAMHDNYTRQELNNLAQPSLHHLTTTWVDDLAREAIWLDEFMAGRLELPVQSLGYPAQSLLSVTAKSLEMHVVVRVDAPAQSLVSALGDVNRKFDSFSEAERTVWRNHAVEMDRVKQRIENAVWPPARLHEIANELLKKVGDVETDALLNGIRQNRMQVAESSLHHLKQAPPAIPQRTPEPIPHENPRVDDLARLTNSYKLIKGINTKLRRQVKAVLDKADKDVIPDSVLNNLAGGDARRARVIWKKLRLKQEFPMSFAEARAPYLTYAGAASPITATDLPPLPAYTKALQNISAANTAPQPFLESSTMLLLALQQNRGVTISLDDLGSAAIDVNKDGLKELVDGYGNPIAFFRFPTGDDDMPFGRNMPGYSALFAPRGTGSKYPDPLDPDGLLLTPSWNNYANWSNKGGVYWYEQLCHLVHAPNFRDNIATAKSYAPWPRYMVPIVISAGPDGKWGMSATAGINPNMILDQKEWNGFAPPTTPDWHDNIFYDNDNIFEPKTKPPGS